MYCPHCESNVLTRREDLDICLAIILFFFTAGLGLFIYLIYYYGQEENRCVHCNSVCLPQRRDQEISVTPPIKNPYHQNQDGHQVQLIETETNENTGVNYCSSCGSKLERKNISFCPYCGTSIS